MMTSGLKVTILIFSLLLFLFNIGAYASISACSSLVDDPGVKAEEEQSTAPGEEKEDKIKPNYDTLEESLPPATGEKPTIVIPDLKIITVSNSWGKVSLDVTTVNTKIVINDPNLYLVPLKVLCDIYLNGIKMVADVGEDMQITKCASGTSVRFSATIDNENIIKWWVSHIKRGEKTKVRIEGKLIISLDRVDLVYPYFRETEFETNMLKGLNGRNLGHINVEIIKLGIDSLSSRWGKVSQAETQIIHKLTIHNFGFTFASPTVTDVEYELTLNGIKMARGNAGLPLILLPGQKRSVTFTSKIDNGNIIKWWVSHISGGEKTKYCLRYTPMVKFLGARVVSWPNKRCGVFQTNFFSQEK